MMHGGTPGQRHDQYIGSALEERFQTNAGAPKSANVSLFIESDAKHRRLKTGKARRVKVSVEK